MDVGVPIVLGGAIAGVIALAIYALIRIESANLRALGEMEQRRRDAETIGSLTQLRDDLVERVVELEDDLGVARDAADEMKLARLSSAQKEITDAKKLAKEGTASAILAMARARRDDARRVPEADSGDAVVPAAPPSSDR